MSKYGNVPTQIDGHVFHSKLEARRYQELKALQVGGLISELELQPRFNIEINGVHICRYFADFRYYDNERKETVVEDAKGMRTEVYKLKARLMKAI